MTGACSNLCWPGLDGSQLLLAAVCWAALAAAWLEALSCSRHIPGARQSPSARSSSLFFVGKDPLARQSVPGRAEEATKCWRGTCRRERQPDPCAGKLREAGRRGAGTVEAADRPRQGVAEGHPVPAERK